MENFEDFIAGSKHYQFPVVSSIKLTEEQPDTALLNSFFSKEIRKEKRVFFKKTVGLLLLIASVFQFVGILMNVSRDYYYDFPECTAVIGDGRMGI